jgi:hypothetical protein
MEASYNEDLPGIWFVRRSAVQPKKLILDIEEKRQGGRHFEWRLVLERSGCARSTEDEDIRAWARNGA